MVQKKTKELLKVSKDKKEETIEEENDQEASPNPIMVVHIWRTLFF